FPLCFVFFFSSRRRHTRFSRDWSSDVCSSDLIGDVIYAYIVPYATSYRFRITDPVNPANTQEIDRVTRDFRLNLVTAFPVQYNRSEERRVGKSVVLGGGQIVKKGEKADQGEGK